MFPWAQLPRARLGKSWNMLNGFLSIELMCAAQALDLRRPLRGSAAIESMHVEVRNVIPMLNEDRFLQTDIEAMRQLIISGKSHKSAEMCGQVNSHDDRRTGIEGEMMEC